MACKAARVGRWGSQPAAPPCPAASGGARRSRGTPRTARGGTGLRPPVGGYEPRDPEFSTGLRPPVGGYEPRDPEFGIPRLNAGFAASGHRRTPERAAAEPRARRQVVELTLIGHGGGMRRRWGVLGMGGQGYGRGTRMRKGREGGWKQSVPWRRGTVGGRVWGRVGRGGHLRLEQLDACREVARQRRVSCVLRTRTWTRDAACPISTG